MKRIIVLLVLATLVIKASAQENVGEKIEELTLAWDGEADKLATYEGLTEFCTVEPYRNRMIETLRGIHHYDSVLYDVISKKARYGGGDAEMKKTLKDIEKFETDFSIKEFLVFLHEECNARNDIERNAKKTGENKDAEAYVLETELNKYVKNITKRIDILREHVHHLNIK